AGVVLKMSATLGAGDGNNIVAFVQQPGERDLSGSRPLALAHLAHNCGGTHVRIEVFALIARVSPAEIALRIFLSTLYSPGEKAATQRRERHEPDPQLAQQRDNTRFEVAFPERILTLKRGDRVH